MAAWDDLRLTLARLAEATRLATEDDASVAGGFFAVTVRPWQVMMRAEPQPGQRAPGPRYSVTGTGAVKGT
jgi:hypothetical protein